VTEDTPVGSEWIPIGFASIEEADATLASASSCLGTIPWPSGGTGPAVNEDLLTSRGLDEDGVALADVEEDDVESILNLR
jgi:hypothetical protein